MPNSFSDFSLDADLVHSLSDFKFTSPTPVQNQVIPLVLDGEDVLAQAETGSGKTGAFVIPILDIAKRHIQQHKSVANSPLFIILAPTRELAQQIQVVSEQFGAPLGIRSICVIGGERIQDQKKDMDIGVHILVATPGRLTDLYKQRLVSFDECIGLVLDEVDRLFDMGFKDEIHFLLSKIPKDRQLLMFTATHNLEVLNMAYRFRSEPVEIKLNQDEILVENIRHSLIHLGDGEKMRLLVGMLRDRPEDYTIIFCNTQKQTHLVDRWLQELGFKVKGISGSLPQNRRSKLMEQFRQKEIQILVSTDVAARGLDIKDVNLVINYDLPSDPSNYVHRIGRTGRAGKDGRAISFCAYRDCEYLGPIEDYIKGKIPVEDIDEKQLATDIGQAPLEGQDSSEHGDDERSGDGQGSREHRPRSGGPRGRGGQNRGRNSRGPSKRNHMERVRESRGQDYQGGGHREGYKDHQNQTDNHDLDSDDNLGNSLSSGPTHEQRHNNYESRGPRRGRNNGRNSGGDRGSRRFANDQRSNGRRPQRHDRNDRFDRSDRQDRHNHHDRRDREDHDLRPKRRIFETTTTNLKEAEEQAIKFFRLEDDSLVGHRVIEEGKRKFFGLGPKEVRVEFFVKPDFEVLIGKFLNDLFKMMELKITADITYVPPLATVELNGADEDLLAENNGELLSSIDHVLKKYLGKLVELTPDFRLRLNSEGVNRAREANLKSLAESSKARVLETGRAVILDPMSPSDRRLVHQFLDQDTEVKTRSLGHGHFKRVKIDLIKAQGSNQDSADESQDYNDSQSSSESYEGGEAGSYGSDEGEGEGSQD